MIAKVPMIEVGMASAETIVAVKFRKNMKTMMIANMAPKTKSNFTWSTLCMILSD